LSGASGLDPEWEQTVDAASSANPHTTSRASIGDVADALYEVFHEGMLAKQKYVAAMAAA
jgi:hypothetical protein